MKIIEAANLLGREGYTVMNRKELELIEQKAAYLEAQAAFGISPYEPMAAISEGDLVGLLESMEDNDVTIVREYLEGELQFLRGDDGDDDQPSGLVPSRGQLDG